MKVSLICDAKRNKNKKNIHNAIWWFLTLSLRYVQNLQNKI